MLMEICSYKTDWGGLYDVAMLIDRNFQITFPIESTNKVEMQVKFPIGFSKNASVVVNYKNKVIFVFGCN